MRDRREVFYVAERELLPWVDDSSGLSMSGASAVHSLISMRLRMVVIRFSMGRRGRGRFLEWLYRGERGKIVFVSLIR